MNCSRPVKVLSHSGIEQFFPCGKCICCRASKAKEWAQRLKNEETEWLREGFITLTYDDAHLPEGGRLVKKDLQDAIKRLRYYAGTKIKYYACGEYGSKTWRPHYHAIVFGLDSRNENILRKAWTLGSRVSIEPVLPGGIEYVTGYVRKKIDIKYGLYRDYDLPLPFALQSQGLGYTWAEKNKKILEKNGLTREGHQIAIPRYYIRKLKLNYDEYYSELKKQYDTRDIEFLNQGFDYNDIFDASLLAMKQNGINAQRKYKLRGHE